MTVYATPSPRGVSAWEVLSPYLEMVEDGTVYESQPTSWVNPALTAGQSAGGRTPVIFTNGFDCDYKWSGGDGAGDGMGVFAVPDGGDYPADAIYAVFEVGAAAKDWTHAHLNLVPGLYRIGVGIQQHGATAVYGHVDNIEIQPSLLLTAPAPTSWTGIVSNVPAGSLEIAGNGPAFGPTFAEIPAAELILAGRNPTGVWTVPQNRLATATVIYDCTLTGAADGVANLVLPIASFQARVRDGEPSYVSVTVPNSLAYEDAIAARTNGEIVIRKGYRMADGTTQMEEICRVDYEDIQISRGGRSDAAVVTGHATVSSTAPKEWTVTGVSFYGLQADGKRRVRADLDLFLRVGDTCVYGTGANDFFVVGQITYWVTADPPAVFMEVQEV